MLLKKIINILKLRGKSPSSYLQFITLNTQTGYVYIHFNSAAANITGFLWRFVECSLAMLNLYCPARRSVVIYLGLSTNN